MSAFSIFYLLCAAAGAADARLVDTASEAPLIGASGAISGVVAAYFLLHPKVRVWVLVFFRIPLPLPAFIPLAFWIGQQFYMLVVDPATAAFPGARMSAASSPGSSWWSSCDARGVPLFDRTIVTPRAVAMWSATPRRTRRGKHRSQGQADRSGRPHLGTIIAERRA